MNINEAKEDKPDEIPIFATICGSFSITTMDNPDQRERDENPPNGRAFKLFLDNCEQWNINLAITNPRGENIWHHICAKGTFNHVQIMLTHPKLANWDFNAINNRGHTGFEYLQCDHKSAWKLEFIKLCATERNIQLKMIINQAEVQLAQLEEEREQCRLNMEEAKAQYEHDHEQVLKEQNQMMEQAHQKRQQAYDRFSEADNRLYRHRLNQRQY